MFHALRRAKQNDVALLAEGVGRNRLPDRQLQQDRQSPSSRRAWVEIRCAAIRSRVRTVALLAEGVGRNWIRPVSLPLVGVALLAEGVGRNVQTLVTISSIVWSSPSSRRAWVEIFEPLVQNGVELRRPPRGGRG